MKDNTKNRKTDKLSYWADVYWSEIAKRWGKTF